MLDFTLKTKYTDFSLEEFKSHVQNCQRCLLYKTRQHVVFGSGAITSDLMIVGEAPGELEDIHGKPFIGRSGNLLTKLLESVDINRDKDVFIANAVKCRPPKNRTPTAKEIATCSSYLVQQVQLVKPKVLVLLGAPSMTLVLGKKHKITKVRGQWFMLNVNYMKQPLHVMPMFHPAYLLRNPSEREGGPKWLTYQDLKKVKQLLTTI